MSWANRNTVVQRRGDCGTIRGEAIRRDLKRSGRGLSQSFNQNVCARLVPLSDGDVQDQLRVPFNSDVNVAVAQVLIVLGTGRASASCR
jgi:hypothetical protein